MVADHAPPVIARVNPEPGTTVERLDSLAVTFNEPVTGVVAAHLLVNGIGAASVTAVDETTFTFTFPPPAYGSITVGWNPRQTIRDLADPPNAFNATAPGAIWGYLLVDHTAPSVAGLLPGRGATVRTLESLTVLFSEPVSGVDATDLTINGQPATAVTRIAASEYVFAFPQPEPGTVQFAWAAGHAIADLASPSNAFTGAPGPAGSSTLLRIPPTSRSSWPPTRGR